MIKYRTLFYKLCNEYRVDGKRNRSFNIAVWVYERDYLMVLYLLADWNCLGCLMNSNKVLSYFIIALQPLKYIHLSQQVETK